MAQMIDQWPEITRTRKSRYPWDEWANGAIWQVQEGTDFDSSLKTFVQGLYAYAKRHESKVEVRSEPASGVVAFRFVPKGPQDVTADLAAGEVDQDPAAA